MERIVDKLIVSTDFAIYRGFLNPNASHSHNTLQLTISSKKTFDVLLENKIIECKSIQINKKVKHQIITNNSELITLLFEPTINCEYKFYPNFDKYIIFNNIGDVERSVFANNLKYITEMLLSYGEFVPLDNRIQKILNHINKEENCKHSLGYFAEWLSLSESRISHLFKKEVGVSLKYYLLWKRLLFAIDSLRSSRPLTEIALDCGFSDLSHLSRTFKRFFGHKISEFIQDSSSVQVEYIG